jgi:hypothetical protein
MTSGNKIMKLPTHVTSCIFFFGIYGIHMNKPLQNRGCGPPVQKNKCHSMSVRDLEGGLAIFK